MKIALSFVGLISLNSPLLQLKINQNQIIQYFLWMFFNCQDWPADKMSLGILQGIFVTFTELFLFYK